MYDLALPFDSVSLSWRLAARDLLGARVLPEQVGWRIAETATRPALPPQKFRVRVPERFLTLAGVVAHHAAADRFDRLYRMAFRLMAQPGLIDVQEHPDTAALLMQEAEVLRALKRLKTGLRLHDIGLCDGQKHYAGWSDTAHDPLPLYLPEVQRRFSDLGLTVFTPQRIIHWQAGRLSHLPPVTRPLLPRETGDTFWAAWLRDQVLNRKCMTSPSLTT